MVFLFTWSAGGIDDGCDNVEFGWGDGPALPGEPTDGIAVRDSGIEWGFLEYNAPSVMLQSVDL